MKRLFEECGVEDEKLETFLIRPMKQLPVKTLHLWLPILPIHDVLRSKTPDVVIHIDPNRAALIETQVIAGRKCIVIPMEGDVEINGIHVSSGNSESTES